MKMMLLSMIAVLAVLAATPAEANGSDKGHGHANKTQVWDRCTLARKLIKSGIPRSQLDQYMCIAFRESRYDQSHINYNPSDGSRDYGVFQVNSRWWCTSSTSPAPNQNLCNVSCETLLTDIDATIKCIKFMYSHSKNTYQPWITWPYCQKMDMTQFTKGCNC